MNPPRKFCALTENTYKLKTSSTSSSQRTISSPKRNTFPSSAVSCHSTSSVLTNVSTRVFLHNPNSQTDRMEWRGEMDQQQYRGISFACSPHLNSLNNNPMNVKNSFCLGQFECVRKKYINSIQQKDTKKAGHDYYQNIWFARVIVHPGHDEIRIGHLSRFVRES